MQTECISDRFEFTAVARRRVEAGFDGGTITSDAGALLLGATDRAIGLIDRFADCFKDRRCQELVEHSVGTLVGQRVFGIALGYDDIVDHDALRHDPIFAVLAGKLSAKRADCAPVAGKSTLNRLELSQPVATRYHKISHDPTAIEGLFVDLFLEAHAKAPGQITLDLDATDDPLHGDQEGRLSKPPRMLRSTVTTSVTAICRFMCFAADIYWRPSFGVPTSTRLLGRSKRSNASWRRSECAGLRPGFCCGLIQALPVMS